MYISTYYDLGRIIRSKEKGLGNIRLSAQAGNWDYLPQEFSKTWKEGAVWQYGVWSFQTGGIELERFLPKNQHTKRKFLNFENWTNGEVSKSAKSPNLPTFKVNFLYQKLSESFSIFFSLKNINLGAHFLLLTFFDTINF